MISNIIKLSLGSLSVLAVLSCQSSAKHKNSITKRTVDSCRYYRYDAGRIVSNLGCTNCHLLTDVEKKNDKGWTTFGGLALMDSLKLLDYTFTKKHKGWYADSGSYKGVKMDTLNNCEIRSVIRYIKDFGRDIPMPAQ